MLRVSKFMRRLLALTAVGQAAFAAAAASVVPWPVAVVLAAAATIAFVPVANRGLRGERHAVDLPYFVHWTASFLAIALAPLALVLFALLHRPLAPAPAIGYLAALAIAAYGALVRRRWTRVQRVDVRIDGLDPRFDGYRIAHLSDLHIGPFTPRAWGLRWARAASALDCDLAVVTGDLVTQGSAFHADIADVVGAIRARDGVLLVMGNHDYAEAPESLVAMLEARGARVLRNESVVPRAGLFVAGIDDRWSRRADMDRALEKRPDGASAILLAHDPVDFEAAAARGVDLVLSGHTHGGQIALPLAARRFNFGRLHRRHTLGFYRKGRSALVVHPGLGTSGPPVRVGVAPAILEITLRRGDPSGRRISSGPRARDRACSPSRRARG
ncbi:MAG TPA: metallophosphoesterase [Polyangiaceae bacterium]